MVRNKAKVMSTSTPTDTTLHGALLTAARAVWIILVVLIIGLWGVGTAVLFQQPMPDCIQSYCDPIDFNAGDLAIARQMGLPVGLLSLGSGLIALGSALANFVIAAIIFWRKSDDWMGLLVSFTLVFLGGVLFTSSNDALLRVFPQANLLMDALSMVGMTALFLLFYIFPDGRFVPRWMRWPALILILATVLPSSTPSPESGGYAIFGYVFVVLFLSAGGAQIFRYIRVSTPAQRQQTKWVIFGLIGSLALMSTWMFIAVVYPPYQHSAERIHAMLVVVPFIVFFALLLPLTFGFSILRYKLWDIDVIIQRTLSYGALTLALGAVYFGSVVLLQSLFTTLTGQQSPVAVVISTLIIAALFSPLRRRIQQAIDRRFYRSKYDAEQALAALSNKARQEVDLDDLTREILNIVETTMQPEHVSLWLRSAPSGAVGELPFEG